MAASASNEEYWRALLTGEDPSFGKHRRRYKRIPGRPRCKMCLFPLGGPAARVLSLFLGTGPSRKNPRFCNLCERFAERHRGGVELELSLLFADVRGSTTLAEGMDAAAFSRLMNSFYEASNRVLIDSDALIDKLVGDEVIGLYLPVIGPEHPRKAIFAARDLLLALGYGQAEAPRLPVGAGVHTGTAYVGAVGSADTVTDFTALGDAVNVTARLSAAAASGEVLISDEAYAASGLDLGELERRRLELKGRTAPVAVRVLRLGPGSDGEAELETAGAAAGD